MKSKKGLIGNIALLFLLLGCLLIASPSYAQTMNDYCLTPPFIVGGVNPNLLLMIDNSGSMYDLTYIDEGSATRDPYYCYDQTYNFGAHYSGYFVDWFEYYEYDFTNNYFVESASAFPVSCDILIPSTLCINGTNLTTDAKPKTVTEFIAEGNYLNWLSSSKFDVQKEILTGGKYDTVDQLLINESRGCVGRRFIKEPIQEISYTEGGTNTPLGITIAVRGPEHPYSDTLIGLGGQTYLEIYSGDYQEQLCQQAIDDIVNQENKLTIQNSIETCLNYDDKSNYCSLDINTSCDTDADCAGTPGTCNIVNDGICNPIFDGNCALTIAGTCTNKSGNCSAGRICIGGANAGAVCSNNNQCDSNLCSKVCQGGAKDGAECLNNNDCNYYSCDTGKVGDICSVASDCDSYTCTNAGSTFGNACVANSDCNNRFCSAGLVGNPCTINSDCNTGTGTCDTGPLVGNLCLNDLDCTAGYLGICQKPVTQQIKSTYGQSIHECYQYWNTGSLIGTNWLTIVTNPQGCNQIYREYKICNGGARDGKTCVTSADCTGGTCINGPQAIRPGSPALICGISYTGYCANSSDNWQTTNWLAREYASYNLCVKAKFEAFCGDTQVAPVTDPTDDPSTTENFDNLPPIIGDIGIESQLGDPVDILTVSLNQAEEPSGLLQEFERLIRFGAMTFNDYGSSTECPANISCTKVCSTAQTVCTVDADCPIGDTCGLATNYDGGQVIHHIERVCSTTVSTTCSSDADCPAGESCTHKVGDHTVGLVKAVDDVVALTWTPFAEGFYNAIGYFANRTDLRLNPNDFDATKPPSEFRCQKNNVLLITDGMSTADLNADVNTLVTSYNDGDGQIDTAVAATCPEFAGSRNVDDLAWLAQNKNIKDFSQAPSPTSRNSQTITSYVVFNGVPSTDPGECEPETLMQEMADNGAGTYQRAENPEQLEAALRAAFQQIAGKAASGTAASVLATGEGSGANLVQAIFYPEQTIAGTDLNWTGSLKNLWYFIDPFLGNSNIREDSDLNKILTLTGDYVIHFFFDTNDNITKANLYADADGNGVADSSTPTDTVYFESVKSLWEAAGKLWAKDPATRTIYTTVDGSSRMSFSTPIDDATAAGVDLIANLQAPNKAVAEKIVDYVRGVDHRRCSTTTSTACAQNTDCPVGETCVPGGYCSTTTGTACVLDANCPAGESCMLFRNRTVTVGGVTNTVKLGDIINSTPRIVSQVAGNLYHKTYFDESYLEFVESDDYQDRGMVFVGANDGMLHAFRLGRLELFNEKNKKAQLHATDLSGTGIVLGDEAWAFVPKNVLPYLRYMADTSYCHLYYVDLTPYIFDASIGTTGCSEADYWECSKYDGTGLPLTDERWRTILIGGMRMGGGCKNPADADTNGVADACTKDMNFDGTIDNDDCALAVDTDKGYSSYFALDITDPADPSVLWEFSHPSLGFSTTGPAVVRIAAKKGDTNGDGDTDGRDDPDNTKNGRWFVLFGSGSTGPIDTDTHQFKGFSDQNMKVFLLDLEDGSLVRTFDSGIANSFAGSMINAPIDFDQGDSFEHGFYQDDAVYFGFVKAETNPPVATTKWNAGGVMRLYTKNSLDPDSADADERWVMNQFINVGPVPSAVAKLQNYKTDEFRLYWGTGRYYYKIAADIDDADSGRRIYGVLEPCYTSTGFDLSCSTTVAAGDLGDANAGASADPDGWYIDLDSCTDISGAPISCADAAAIYKAERTITDTLATPIGGVFFTTTKPTSDICEFGGVSHLWGVDYETGGEINSSVLRGKALLQVSTGSIEEVDLKTAFKQDATDNPYSRNNRRTAAFQGVPPTGSPPGLLLPPDPLDRFIHIREQ